MVGIGVAFSVLVPIHGQPNVPVTMPWWAFVAVVALIEFPLIHLYVKSEAHSFTLGELALCLGLFLVPPDMFVLAAALGAILAKVRLPPVKLAFNTALWVMQAGVALTIFHVFGDSANPFGVRSVVATFAAMAVVGALGVIAVSGAISLVQGRLAPARLGLAGSIATAVNVANTGLGLIAVYLIAQEPHLVVALVGPIAVLFFAYRGFTGEADALLVRIRAAAIILRDPRWQNWATYFKATTPGMHRAFDAVMLDVIATLPLDAALRFSPDAFFDALLSRLPLVVQN